MNEIPPALEPAVPLASDPRWRLAERVAQSAVFRKSPRLRSFLRFVVEQRLRDPAAEPGEYEIGLHVFERGSGFYPQSDSIVRSSARLLRTKLNEYFAGEGRDEPVIIEVPKGGYVPEFINRPVALAEGVARQPAGRSRIGIYAVSAVCAILLAACVVLWKNRAAASSASSSEASPPNLIFALFPPGAELNLVYGDSAKVVAADLRPSNLALDEYLRAKELEESGAPAVSDAAGSRLITGYRDAAFGLRLAESAERYGRVLIARHSRLMQARDFRAGNFILLGGVLSNPMEKLFESQLNFRFESDNSGGQHRYGFRNVAPRAREETFYSFAAKEGRSERRYARIALTPNLTSTGKVLSLAGQSAEGTEGAGDAALARDFPTQVKALLGNRALHEVTGLELLLRVDSIDGGAHQTTILAYRVR